MGDMKDKFKGFMKNTFSSSSSGKFKGQGRVLGSSSSSGPADSVLTRPKQAPQSHPKPVSNSNSNSSVASPNPKPSPQKTQIIDQEKTQIPVQSKAEPSIDSKPDRKTETGFDPFDALITPGKRSQNGFTLNVFECPICGQSFRSEDEVSIHVDSCVNTLVETKSVEGVGVSGSPDNGSESSRSELEARIGTFASGNPAAGSVEVVLRLLRNIVKEPENVKFRRLRMSNPKIREAIGEVVGGIELLEFVGFELKEEDGEMWAVMEVPKEEQISLMKKGIALLEPPKVQEADISASIASLKVDESVEPKKVDRQTRVFFSVSESVAARIEVPASFYNLSATELKREAEMRKKKIEDSQMLIPKSFKEKQAKAAKRRYRKTVIRIQFPDGVVLQGVFSPLEPTSSLYEYVSSALKEPSLEFELLNPVALKRRVIPHFPAAGKKAATLADEDLMPSALVKFKPIETDSVVFTGLCNELLEISEPLTSGSAAAPVNSVKTSGSPSQLTIFYAGTVNVYDDISPEKAQALMLLAGNGCSSSFSAAQPKAQAPSAKLPVEDGVPVNRPTNLPPPALSSPLSVSSHTGAQSVSGSTSTDELMAARTTGRPTSSVNKMEAPETANAVQSVAATSMIPSAVPQARKASLARFLEKRKERVMSAAPYNFDKKSPEYGTPESNGVNFGQQGEQR